MRLSEEERSLLKEVIKKLKGTSQRVRGAQILLKADADGPNWTDKRLKPFLVVAKLLKTFVSAW